MIPQYAKNKNKGYIVESGSNNNGSYVKFSDGTMICRNSLRFYEIPLTTASGVFFNGVVENQVVFPHAFIDIPEVIMNTIGSTDYHYCFISGAIKAKTGIPSITFSRTNSVQANIALNYIAIGKWK